MSKFKKKIAKRILAYILSGAMIMSNMTAFASESSDDTGGGYIEEVADTDDVGIEEAEEAEEAEKDENSEETEKTNESEKTDKEEANTENDTATTVETKETQTSETKSSSSVDKEDTVDEEDTTEADEKTEDVKAAATLTADMVKVGGKPVATNGKAEYTVEYNDEAIEPEVSIENCVKDTDFTVSYKDNNAAGTATITVTPVADSQQLTGDAVEITFEITAKQTTTALSEKTETNTYTLDFDTLCRGEDAKTLPFEYDIFTVPTDGKIGDRNSKKIYVSNGSTT
ncbi:MAG: hypothetical protein K2N90_02845, partial [Lachnospiraceae bacterium]|nr:hypothetical protein [Lachnospiraceae bacterium]